MVGAPIAGFVYPIFNLRFTWLKGSIPLVGHLVRQKFAQPTGSMRAHAATFRTRYWQSAKEYRHMSFNNVVLLSAWALLSYALATRCLRVPHAELGASKPES
jgi:omega-6 fatty acid desaturase (delta-12 desaturase)